MPKVPSIRPCPPDREPKVLGLFTKDQAVIEEGVRYLSIISWTYLIYALSSAFVFHWSPVVTFCFLKADQRLKCIPNSIVCNRFRWVRILTQEKK